MAKNNPGKNNKKTREKKIRRVLIILLLVLLLMGVTVGYAVLSTSLNISGTSRIKNSTWDVHFQNISVVNGSVQAIEGPSVDASKLNVNYSVELKSPGDYFEFTVDVKNAGGVDAKLSALPSLDGISSEQDVFANYSLTHADGSPVQVGEAIMVGESRKYKVRVEFEPNITEKQLPKDDQILHLNASMSFIQA